MESIFLGLNVLRPFISVKLKNIFFVMKTPGNTLHEFVALIEYYSGISSLTKETYSNIF